MGWTLRKRVVAVLGAAAVAGAMGLVATAGPAAGQTTFTPSSSTPDGDLGSLRRVLEDDISDGDIVVLDGGTYTLFVPGLNGGDIDISAAVTIQGNGSTIQQTVPSERVLDTEDDLTLQNVTITGGHLGTDDGGAVQVDSTSATLMANGATFTDNSADDAGAVEADGPTTIRNSTFSNNSSGDDGGALRNAGPATIIASTFVQNCAEDDGGAVEGDDPVLFVNSTVTGNTADENGALNPDDADLTLVYTDVVDNIHEEGVTCPNTPAAVAAVPDDPSAVTASPEPDDVEAQDVDEPANIELGEEDELLAFGSVVALPRNAAGEEGTPFNCDLADSTTTSSGFNFSDDDTCGFTETGQGDRENAGDPGLAALADNGGPTQTRLPEPGSPLLNFIPIPDCGGGDELAGFELTTDQRGVSRPQETGCEVGSVEIEPPPEPVPPAVVPTAVPVEPRFTG
jgi:hypothetical protein